MSPSSMTWPPSEDCWAPVLVRPATSPPPTRVAAIGHEPRASFCPLASALSPLPSRLLGPQQALSTTVSSQQHGPLPTRALSSNTTLEQHGDRLSLGWQRSARWTTGISSSCNRLTQGSPPSYRPPYPQQTLSTLPPPHPHPRTSPPCHASPRPACAPHAHTQHAHTRHARAHQCTRMLGC